MTLKMTLLRVEKIQEYLSGQYFFCTSFIKFPYINFSPFFFLKMLSLKKFQFTISVYMSHRPLLSGISSRDQIKITEGYFNNMDENKKLNNTYVHIWSRIHTCYYRLALFQQGLFSLYLYDQSNKKKKSEKQRQYSKVFLYSSLNWISCALSFISNHILSLWLHHSY